MRKSKISDKVIDRAINLEDIFDDGWIFSLNDSSLTPEEWMNALEKCLVSEQSETEGMSYEV
jgi:hypothetical protein